MAHWYAELRRHSQQTGRRVTADAVANLADFLRTGTDPKRLDPLEEPRNLALDSGRQLASVAEGAVSPNGLSAVVPSRLD